MEAKQLTSDETRDLIATINAVGNNLEVITEIPDQPINIRIKDLPPTKSDTFERYLEFFNTIFHVSKSENDSFITIVKRQDDLEVLQNRMKKFQEETHGLTFSNQNLTSTSLSSNKP